MSSRRFELLTTGSILGGGRSGPHNDPLLHDPNPAPTANRMNFSWTAEEWQEMREQLVNKGYPSEQVDPIVSRQDLRSFIDMVSVPLPQPHPIPHPSLPHTENTHLASAPRSPDARAAHAHSHAVAPAASVAAPGGGGAGAPASTAQPLVGVGEEDEDGEEDCMMVVMRTEDLDMAPNSDIDILEEVKQFAALLKQKLSTSPGPQGYIALDTTVFELASKVRRYRAMMHDNRVTQTLANQLSELVKDFGGILKTAATLKPAVNLTDAVRKSVATKDGTAAWKSKDFLAAADNDIRCLNASLAYLRCYLEGTLIPGLTSSVAKEDLEASAVQLLKVHSRTTIPSAVDTVDKFGKPVQVNLNKILSQASVNVLVERLIHVLKRLHERLCVAPPNDVIKHQLITACLDLAFMSEAKEAVAPYAIDIIVTICCRFRDLRHSLFRDAAAKIADVPMTGKLGGSRRRGQCDPDRDLSRHAKVMMRLAHSVCGQADRSEQFHAEAKRRKDLLLDKARDMRAAANELASHIYHTCVLRCDSGEHRSIAENLLLDFCDACLSPMWPSAPAFVKWFCAMLFQHEREVVQQNDHRGHEDGKRAVVREFCVHLKGKAVGRLTKILSGGVMLANPLDLPKLPPHAGIDTDCDPSFLRRQATAMFKSSQLHQPWGQSAVQADTGFISADLALRLFLLEFVDNQKPREQPQDLSAFQRPLPLNQTPQQPQTDAPAAAAAAAAGAGGGGENKKSKKKGRPSAGQSPNPTSDDSTPAYMLTNEHPYYVRCALVCFCMDEDQPKQNKQTGARSRRESHHTNPASEDGGQDGNNTNQQQQPKDGEAVSSSATATSASATSERSVLERWYFTEWATSAVRGGRSAEGYQPMPKGIRLYWKYIYSRAVSNIPRNLVNEILKHLDNRAQPTLKRAAIGALLDIVTDNPALITDSYYEQWIVNAVEVGIEDSAARVRDRALQLLEKVVFRHKGDIHFDCGTERSASMSTMRQDTTTLTEDAMDDPGLHAAAAAAAAAAADDDNGSNSNSNSDTARAGQEQSDTIMKTVQRLAEALVTRVDDPSPLVRAKAIKILSEFCLNNPAHDKVCSLAANKFLDRVTTSDETESVQDKILDIFYQLWFDQGRSAGSASDRACIIFMDINMKAATAMDGATESFLDRLFKRATSKRTNRRDRSAMLAPWTSRILNSFLSSQDGARNDTRETVTRRLACLKCLHILSAYTPTAIGENVKYFTPYLTLNKDKVAINPSQGMLVTIVLNIISAVLPAMDTPASLKSTLTKAQDDILKLATYSDSIAGIIKENTPSYLIKAARTCIAAVVQHVTYDYKKCIEPLLVHGVAYLAWLRKKFSESRGQARAREHIVIAHRVAMALGSLLAALPLDKIILSADDLCKDADDGTTSPTPSVRSKGSSSSTKATAHVKNYPRGTRREQAITIESLTHGVNTMIAQLPASSKWEESIGGEFLEYVNGLLLDVFDIIRLNKFQTCEAVALGGILKSCGEFYATHRQFVNSTRLKDAITFSLDQSRPIALQTNALEMLSSLLQKFEKLAVENLGSKEAHNKPASLSDGGLLSLRGAHPADHPHPTPTTATAAASMPTATDSAAPLSHHLPAILAIVRGVRLAAPASANSENGGGGERNDRRRKLSPEEGLCCEALKVVQQLQRQGLINPHEIVAPMFCLYFCDEGDVRGPAVRIIKDLTDRDPNIIVNRLEDCLRESFLAIHRNFAGKLELFQPPDMRVIEPVARVYKERCQKTKKSRERILRNLCHQMEKCSDRSFLESFATTIAEANLSPPPAFHSLLVDQPQPANPPADTDEQPNGDGHEHHQPMDVDSGFPASMYFTLTYLQYVASILGSLMLEFESEALVLVTELNSLISSQGCLLPTCDNDTPTSQGQDAAMSPVDGDPDNGQPAAAAAAASASAAGGSSVRRVRVDGVMAMTGKEKLGGCCVCAAAGVLKTSIRHKYGITDQKISDYQSAEGGGREKEKPKWTYAVDEATTNVFSPSTFQSLTLNLLKAYHNDHIDTNIVEEWVRENLGKESVDVSISRMEQQLLQELEDQHHPHGKRGGRGRRTTRAGRGGRGGGRGRKGGADNAPANKPKTRGVKRKRKYGLSHSDNSDMDEGGRGGSDSEEEYECIEVKGRGKRGGRGRGRPRGARGGRARKE
ncbi:unnamed protein product [Vitrella brassicaformis CCMP3155]|uniref:Sister chromatid cohesion protein n=4 Tax=Vitrella brassicaformis TaxID=1169539 RepID=A0A0G4EX91_VITBC|nr:unnamed protein product [Vitrella brassicaformis CCMP3155]|eukprot:CEM03413.1 unnamed protein product [Vitrella brassicaformis CCMP3155]